MPKHIFVSSCPCCGKQIELNTRNGKVRAVDPKEAEESKDIDSVLEQQKNEGDRLTSVFDEATSDHKGDEKRLSNLFDQAKKEADKDKNKKPDSIWDLE
jgi:hypothetical protein